MCTTKMTPVQWIQEATGNCIKLIDGNNIGQRMEHVKNAYCTFDEGEKEFIHNLIKREFNIYDGIFVLSILTAYVKDERFWMDIAEYILEGTFDCFTREMLEIQLRMHGNIPYSIMRKVHKKSIESFEHKIKGEFSWVPVEEREKKHIVIITEQLLNFQHAPTRMVMEFAYILQEKMNYSVQIYTCTSNLRLPFELWPNTRWYVGREGKCFEIRYKEHLFTINNCTIKETSIDLYTSMLNKIYKWNPIFVLNMGVANPIADLPRKFTTVVAMGMTIECPVSEAQILLREMQNKKELENEYALSIGKEQIQVFLEKRIPPIIEKHGAIYQREQWGLPNDKFVVAIVGNRLDWEVDEKFASLIKKILHENKKIVFSFIGNVTKVKKFFEEDDEKDRIFYLGYCKDLIGVYHLVDLYLNPVRLGGGFSAAMALEAGVPVVTLQNCDVAYYAKEEFCVDNIQEMEKIIYKYADNLEFYEAQQRKIKNIVSKDLEKSVEDSVTWLVSEIQRFL